MGMQSMVDFFAMKDKQLVIRASQILLARKVKKKITSSEKSLVLSILENIPCQTGKYGISLQKWHSCLETKFGSTANLDIMHEINTNETLMITTNDHLMVVLLASVGRNKY